MKNEVKLVVVSMPISEEIRPVPFVSCEAVRCALEGIMDEKPDLILFPQYTVNDNGTAEEACKIRLLHEFAVKNGCYVVYNVFREKEGQKRCISIIIDRSGNIEGEYVKTHSVDGLDESLSLGSEMPVFELDFGKVALLSGTDIYFPELSEIYSIKGAEILLCSMGPLMLRDDAEIQKLLKARAIADYMFIAAATYASDKKMYMASNFELMNLGSDVVVGNDASEKYFNSDIDNPGINESFNSWGLGRHTGRAVVYDLRGEMIASTGRESGFVSCRINLQKKRKITDYLFGTGCILFHQNQRGVFKELLNDACYCRGDYSVKKPVISMVYVNYLDTIKNFNKNTYDKTLDLVGKAASKSDLVICAEYSKMEEGTPQNPEEIDRFVEKCSSIAKENNCYISINDVIDRRNKTVLFGRDGRIIVKYQKVNPLTAMYEKKFEAAGNDINVYELDFGKVGLMICADSYCQEIPRILALKGAEMVILQSQSWGFDAGAINEGISRAWAIENCIYFLMANFPSSQIVHRSNLIDPTGETVLASAYDREGIYGTEVDFDAVRKKTSFMYRDGKVVKDYSFRARIMKGRRPELYGLLGGKTN